LTILGCVVGTEIGLFSLTQGLCFPQKHLRRLPSDGAIGLYVLPFMWCPDWKKYLVNSYQFLQAFPAGKMNIFGSLPVSAVLHGFVGIRAKSWW